MLGLRTQYLEVELYIVFLKGNTELEFFLLWSYFDFFLLIKGPGIRKNKGTKLIKDELRFLEIFFFIS